MSSDSSAGVIIFGDYRCIGMPNGWQTSEILEMESEDRASPRFIADVMVGKLARWLRLLGFDVLYSNRCDDDEIVRRAAAENRTLLTRDRGIRSRVPPESLIFIE